MRKWRKKECINLPQLIFNEMTELRKQTRQVARTCLELSPLQTTREAAVCPLTPPSQSHSSLLVLLGKQRRVL